MNHAIIHCVFHWENPRVDPALTAHFDRILWLCTALAWTIGPLLIYGILHYEWFGGDPQKRSLGNRLLSHGILTLVAGAFCVQALLILVRYDLGNTLVYMTFFRGYLGFMLATVGFVELNFILRYAQIHVWGCVKEINEDLAMTAIGISVLCVALATGYCQTINLPIRNFFMSYSQVVTPCVLCICFVFNLFGFIRIKCQRQAISPLVVHDRSPADETRQWASQIRYNKALFTNAASPIFCIFLVVGIYTTTDYAMSFPIEQKELKIHRFFCMQILSHMIFTPMVFYIFSSDSRKHIKKVLDLDQKIQPIY